MTGTIRSALTHRAVLSLDGRLLSADPKIAQLQADAGGEPNGLLALPALLALARHSMRIGMRLTRAVETARGDSRIEIWCECEPSAEGVTLNLSNWREHIPATEVRPTDSLHRDGESPAGEPYIRLDRDLRVTRMVWPEDQGTLEAVDRSMLAPVTEVLEFVDPLNHLEGPAAWLALRQRKVRLIGDVRVWMIDIHPDFGKGEALQGFDLYLISLQPAESADTREPALMNGERLDQLFNEQLGPALRRPIGRIIANAETIGGGLSGPVRSTYASYAGDIADAGRHLLALVDDLSDLEAIESEGFRVSVSPLDLGDLARRASGFLALRAADRNIDLVMPDASDALICIGEERRVLQILLNLVGNAINYSPVQSAITIELGRNSGFAYCSVVDRGPGLTDDQQARLFQKWERLGRSGDGGSGLGLYISRRLANAMGGTLDASSTPGQGSRFTLSLPLGG